MQNFLKRYKGFIIILIVNLIVGVTFHDIGVKSLVLTKINLVEMLSVIPPIFILLGLLDVWVPKETMMKYIGDKSGIKGILIGFLLGSAAAGPLYAAFPVATVMLKKGAGVLPVFIFIGAWSTTKIPMLTFEAANMGLRYMLLRLVLSIIGIILIATFMDIGLSKKEKENIYKMSGGLGDS